MDALLVDSATQLYEKRLRILIASPTSLITGGMVADVLISRTTLQAALNSEPVKGQRAYLGKPVSEDKLLEKIDYLDRQLQKQAPHFLSEIDMAGLRNEGSESEFYDRIVIGWWWYLEQDQSSI